MADIKGSADELARIFGQAGIAIAAEKTIPYGLQLTVTDGSYAVTVNIYGGKKGISVTVGGGAKDLPLKQKVEEILGKRNAGQTVNGELPPGFEEVEGFDHRWLGTDESGKGDFFGPLVIAGVAVDKERAEMLTRIGVKDSKALSDDKIRAIAAAVREVCAGAYSEVEITPGRYNQLYNQFKGEGKNLNHLLAWGHAKVLEELLGKAPCRFALADKFADEKYILSRLGERGRKIVLVQTPRAERNIAVAAASVLARDRFVVRMEELSARFGVVLPKGASAAVVEAGRQFVAKCGRAALTEVAKLHFKTVEQF